MSLDGFEWQGQVCGGDAQKYGILQIGFTVNK